MRRRVQPIFFLLGLLAQASGQVIPRPPVPDEIKAPADEHVLLMAHASGSQIYICELATDGAYGWELKAPEAELRDSEGAIIGHHYAGPAWKHNDGSEVTGKAAAKVDSPDTKKNSNSKDAGSIPWLLVTATGHSGTGILTQVTSIQRINTSGGQPPAATECNASKRNTEVKSPYTADYYFYAPAK